MRQYEGSQIRSRNGSAAARGRSVSGARPSWYQRALGGLLLWKQPAVVEASPARAGAARGGGPRWGSSLKAVASALARAVCLCEPVCATDRAIGVQVDAVAPRRTRGRTSRSGGRFPRADVPTRMLMGELVAARSSFRGRSLHEDLLMRRFVLQEEATRRRVQMEEVAKRYGRWWLPPGPSRLSQMSLADDDVAEDEAEENCSSSP